MTNQVSMDLLVQMIDMYELVDDVDLDILEKLQKHTSF